MGTKTFIPAFKAHVGDWSYYICVMKYAQVKSSINFAHEMGSNKDLNTLIQRGISARTADIERYLLKSPHRFLGALIVACWGGSPEYLELQMDDPDGYLSGVDSGFGVLTFDGSQQYFALDGQHRLSAIKSAIPQKPELGAEEICVLLVSHYDTPEGRERTQRLFTNINRTATPTTKAENIALDVDDAFAVITRRLLTEHPFLSSPGRVRIFTRLPSEGDFKLATSNVPVTDKSALTTINVLYEMLKNLDHGLPDAIRDQTTRPDDDTLEEAYRELGSRLDELFVACGDVVAKLNKATNARSVRGLSGEEGAGHPFMRPVVQEAVTRVIGHIMEQETADWKTILERLAQLNWKIDQPPWLAVYNPTSRKMMTAKENKDLLVQLLIAHIAPQYKQDIKRARDSFKATIQKTYPITQVQMEESLPPDKR